MNSELYDTIKALIFYEFPKNSSGQCVIFDQAIKGWYFGDRSILSETPGIVLESGSTPPKFVAFGTQEIEHQIKISCWQRGDNNEILERKVLEFTRLVYEAMLPHRRIWVMTKCPLCDKYSLSPQHYVLEHSDVFGAFEDTSNASGSYVAKAKARFGTIWSESHGSSTPDLGDSGLAVDAFYLFWDDIAAKVYPNTITTLQKSKIMAYQSNKVIPIKIMYDGIFTDIKPVQSGNDQQLFRGGEFTLTVKELRKIPAYGPDNVSTDSWSK